MKKRLLWIAFGAIVLPLWYLSCNKSQSKAGNSPDAELIAADKAYFQGAILPFHNPDTTVSLFNARMALHKTPLWDQAFVQVLSVGRAVVVPLTIKEPLSIKYNNGTTTLSASDITFLLIYSDPSGSTRTEVVTKIPSEDYVNNRTANGAFGGVVRVEDWNGTWIRGFRYSGDTISPVFSSTIFQKDTLKNNEELGVGKVQPDEFPVTGCDIIDWYGCSPIPESDFDVCTYSYSTEDCTGSSTGGGSPGGSGGSTSGGGGGSGGASGSDYGSVGLPPGVLSKYQPDTIGVSLNLLANYPCQAARIGDINKTKCNVYDTIINQLFGANAMPSLTFTVASTEDTSICAYTFSNTKYYDFGATVYLEPNYLANCTSLGLAATIYHEMLHAYLGEVFYNANSNLESVVAGASYLNLASMFNDTSAFSIKIRQLYQDHANDANHETMAAQYINTMAQAIAQYDGNRFNIDFYQKLAWGGLQGTSEWKSMSPADTLAISQVVYAEDHGTTGAVGTKCQ